TPPPHRAQPAEDFQPRQIKCQADGDRPGKDFVIIDVMGELNRIESFNRAGVNENAAHDKIDNSPKKFHCRDLSHSSQPPSSTNTFCIGGCAWLRRRRATSTLARSR